jgi:Kef-type K+ transport system membrane component KefB
MIFFLQMFVILAACRLCGWAVRRFLRQPQVIGEMIAGVLLGPSLLGGIAPEFQQLLFPPESKAVLNVVAQTGIALYMFLVGLDFRGEDFRAHAPSAVAVSVSGIVVPFIVAMLATPLLLGIPGLFVDGVSRFNATLFLGAAIAITAFPVLARIIHDRGLEGTLIATQALSAAAIGDAVAWCVVAVVLASLGAGAGVAVLAIGGGLLFAAVLILSGPRLFAPLGRLAEAQQEAGQPLSPSVLAAALMLCTLSAFISDFIGLHAVFGAFLIGTAMPRGVFAQRIRTLLEPFTLVFLLPVFFTYSGLNTQLAMVNTAQLLLIAVAILAASIFAKFVACWAAARLAGQPNGRSLALGALMNARGLTELIIVNIGLQAEIIAPALFSMLVLMAIVTTLMASPLFEWVYGRKARASGEIPPLGNHR